MIQIKPGSLEEQVLKILREQYPITLDELQKRLHVSKKMVERVVKKLQTIGIVELDILPDKTYIRLLIIDPNSTKRLKKTNQKEDLGMMYR